MQVEPSSVAGVDLVGPDAVEFNEAIESLLGREPDSVLKPAIPYSVIARNNHTRAVVLLGIRFDMVGPQAKSYSVVHYADTLRYPEKAGLAPGTMRFVCAEPLYTDLVLRRGREIDRRGPMNLQNLRKAIQVRASLDCAAFDDGQFDGPDSLGAFERLQRERQAETAFLQEVLKDAVINTDCAIETLLEQAMQVPAEQSRDPELIARRVLAKRLFEALESGGLDAVAARARNHRLRIRLRRPAIGN